MYSFYFQLVTLNYCLVVPRCEGFYPRCFATEDDLLHAQACPTVLCISLSSQCSCMMRPPTTIQHVFLYLLFVSQVTDLCTLQQFCETQMRTSHTCKQKEETLPTRCRNGAKEAHLLVCICNYCFWGIYLGKLAQQGYEQLKNHCPMKYFVQMWRPLVLSLMTGLLVNTPTNFFLIKNAFIFASFFFHTAFNKMSLRVSMAFFQFVVIRFDGFTKLSLKLDDFIQSCTMLRSLTEAFQMHDSSRN